MLGLWASDILHEKYLKGWIYNLSHFKWHALPTLPTAYHMGPPDFMCKRTGYYAKAR